MRQGRPSITARRVALHRAVHQIWDNPPVFEDPVALKILGREAADLSVNVPSEMSARRHLRAFIAARSRYAEDQLHEAIERGVRQYVVLGAGLDTFAYRNPFKALRVFEVDYPATQAWKRQLLASVEIDVPEWLTFAPVDFEKQTLAEGLQQAGFRADQPAFFSWLGVTMYLAPETVLSTLNWLISICANNGIVFDYAAPPSVLNPASRQVFDAMAQRVAAAGEPFVGFFDPLELEQKLRNAGFSQIENLEPAQINYRYFSARTDGLYVGGGAGRLMSARG